MNFATPDDLRRLLEKTYLADDRVALVCYLALQLHKPILVEGPPGVGKTDLARALAEALSKPYLRLQCYEGLDEARALYEWNHAKQLLAVTLRKEQEGATPESLSELYTRDYLLARPLLRALDSEEGAVLLIDEVDRADPEFEAFLLEFLSESQVTIPELGTIKSKAPPLTLLTTNGTRDMTDALRRRCLHLFLDYPTPALEQKILELRVPGVSHLLTDQVSRFLLRLRKEDLQKAPSVSESIDFARALMLLMKSALSPDLVRDLLPTLLKHEEDRARIAPKVDRLLSDT
ncbi:MAG: MoxR family ATPase [Polyangiaceae bacterium]